MSEATFAERLRELRIARGLTQDDVANFLNVNKVTISGYERGIRRPAGENALEVYEALADYFNVDMMYLLGQSDTVTRLTGTQNDPDDDTVSVNLSPSELELLKDYRKAERTVKMAVRTVLRNANVTTLEDGTRVIHRRPSQAKKKQ